MYIYTVVHGPSKSSIHSHAILFSRYAITATDDARERRKGGMSQRFAHLVSHARCHVAGTFRAIVR